MTHKEKLQGYVSFYRKYQGNLSLEDFPMLKGSLPQEAKVSYSELLSDNNADCISYREDSGSVELRVPLFDDAFFAFTIGDLIGRQKHRLKVPENFYIAQLDWFSGETSCPEAIENYLSTVSFIEFLRSIADYVTPDGETFVFLMENKLEIPVKYSEADLRVLSCWMAFKDKFLSDELHREHKKTIVKTVLFELLSNTPELERFSVLLSKIELFCEKAEAGYALYVSGFSFSKMKEKLENDKLDFLMKINKTFSDIQNQLLAIPIALLMAGNGLETGSGLTEKNMLVLLGFTCFLVFTWMLALNQVNTINALKEEIRLRQQENEKFGLEQFSQIYKKLLSRCAQQKCKVRFVLGLISVGWIIIVRLAFPIF